ncbi:hypothetical protein R9C00_09490 [Flammeovirgaceae bacterium SG7u.111]|nr:hypothetical protein [Flammeovirgaceae bacterium SG7u.132]WPO37682.1 hypothetical protein R9C00_09490 [Flammeovirgaceae bacterium SG7u.111]
MKFISAVIIWVLCAVAVQAQTYYVVHVKGNIETKSNNEALKVGAKVSADDELRFITQDATAVVMSREKGRMILNGKKSTKSADGEFLSFVKDVLLPMESNLKMSTRGDYRNIQDFKGFFGEGKYVIIGEELVLTPNKTKFPVDDKKSFIYRYETDSRPVNKKVHIEGDNLVLNKTRLYKTHGVMVDPENTEPVDLIYFDMETKDMQSLAKFKPVFVDEETLIMELQSVASFIRSNGILPEDKIPGELYQFVLDVHGQTNKGLFEEWLLSKDLISKN